MIRIYGASDDLVEVEGDISEEFTYTGDFCRFNGDDLLAFSDGTVIGVRYDAQGIWRLSVVCSGTARVVHQVCTADGFEDDEYSDVIHLFDEELDRSISWVLHGTSLATRKPKR